MIKAVIFDMDGLLIDSEPLWDRAQIAAYKTVGFKPTAKDIQRRRGRGIKSIVADYYRIHKWEGPTPEEIGVRIIDDLLKLVDKEGVLKPGVHRTIEICKAHSLSMAIASSSDRRVINAVVDKLQIRSFFDEIYSAEHEEHSKPHPGVFLTTAKLLDVEPEECLVFEDAPSGVLAAKSARMKCIAVPEPDVKDNKFIQTADHILDSLEEFSENLLKS